MKIQLKSQITPERKFEILYDDKNVIEISSEEEQSFFKMKRKSKKLKVSIAEYSFSDVDNI